VNFASAAKLLAKVTAGVCVGLLGGYFSYHVACGPDAGTFWFWLQEPLLRTKVISYAFVGSAVGALVPV
jgi:hypothetical protein